ncbi:MAG: LytTR family DNA-binding domain-containing protein [Defluviitaleaceae bacterium]|nr:LytTR family DNA-binding domain-containing protein [Defluviitaleaceae bacterium]
MRIAICEDDHAQIKLTESYILRWAEANAVNVEIGTFNSAESFLFRWPHPMEFDVVFLDIQMGGMSGIELAKKIRKQDDRMAIVFVTGLKEYVLRGYDVMALHYLLKPVKEKDCRVCLDRAHELIKKQKSEAFLLPADGQVRKFLYSDIYYFDSSLHYIEVHTTKGDFQYKKKIGDLEQELPGHQFVRCHRTCIVNLAYINSVEKTSLTLDGGQALPVSGDRRRAVNDAFLQYHNVKI